MLSGLKDVEREILKHVDDRELIRVCSIDRKTWNEVCDDNFLKRRLSKYPGIKKYKRENETYKQFFLRFIYYMSLMKESFDFEYKSGDFKKQFDLLRRYRGGHLLIEASALGFLDLVKHATREKIHPYALNKSFIFAIEKNHYDIVKWLIASGSDIRTEENHALKYALKKGYLEIVKLLLENGANIRTALRLAEESGQTEILEYLKNLSK